ncbi:MAG: RloB family protein [Bacteroidia bacterium]|nr:RloB family protein [Bacteroidia bacterium]
MVNKHRKSFNLQLPQRILILCEGESEIKYLKGYQSEEKNRRKLSGVQIELYQPENFSPYGLLTEAKKKAKEANKEKYSFNQVWIVFDRNGHANIPKTFCEATDASVKIAFSLISFEYWILLHFEKSRKYYPNCDSLVHYIESKKYIIDYCKTNYYSKIKEHQQTAIENARWLHKQNESDLNRGAKKYELSAYTNFDELFITLQKILQQVIA